MRAPVGINRIFLQKRSLKRAFEVLRNCLYIGQGVVGELEYVDLVFRKGVLQRVEFTQAKIFVQVVRRARI